MGLCKTVRKPKDVEELCLYCNNKTMKHFVYDEKVNAIYKRIKFYVLYVTEENDVFVEMIVGASCVYRISDTSAERGRKTIVWQGERSCSAKEIADSKTT